MKRNLNDIKVDGCYISENNGYITYDNQQKLVCPYCFRQQEVTDLFNMVDNGGSIITECECCGREFEAGLDMVPNWWSQKFNAGGSKND